MILKSNKQNSAFSYIEVLVSISVIAVISLLLYFSYSVCSKNIYHVHQNLENELKCLRVDNEIRKGIENVRIPYWETRIMHTIRNNSIFISWFNGNNELYEIRLPEYVKEIQMHEIIYSGKTVGFEVSYLLLNKECKTSALFSSCPFGAVAF